MKTLKTNWLKAITGLTFALGVGYFAVNASEKKAEAEKIKSEIETDLLDPIYKWYELVPTNNSNPSFQTLASDQPMLTPPASTGGTDCAQDNSSGDYCAVLVEFAPNATDFTLSDLTNLATAISANSDAVGVASGASIPDENKDGYSRHPQS